jgi:hypothetical protein
MRRPTWANTFITAFSLWLFSGCGGSNAPLAPSPGAQAGRLRLTVSGAEAELIRAVGGYTAIGYGWCYNVVLDSALPAKIMTIERAENTVVGPDGSIYSASAATFQGDRIGGTGTYGYVGCPTVFRDRDLERPLATTYRMRIDYTVEGEVQTFTVSAGGTFASKVPVTAAQMLGIAITHDIPDLQNIIRQRAPVTFVVSGIGGVRPYQYRWRVNETLLRDWNPDSILTWDLMLNGQPGHPGPYTLSVRARSDGGTDVERTADVSVIVWN